MIKRRVLVTICWGMLAGMVAGAPLWGAASPLFWWTGADSNEARRVASLLNAQTRLDPSQDVLMGHMRRHQCGDDVARFVRAGDVTLMGALDQYYTGLLSSKYDNLAVGALAALPAPVLGALQGCVSGSAVSNLCLSAVQKMVIKATAIPKTTERAWLAAADHEIEAAWCAADPAGNGINFEKS